MTLIRGFRRCIVQSSKDNFPLRYNEVNIQMLCHTLHKQIFKYHPHQTDPVKLEKAVKGLLQCGLLSDNSSYTQNINFPLPKLVGSTLEEHFINLANAYSAEYINLANRIISARIPPIPNSFVFESGWVKYLDDGSNIKVSSPDCDVMVFDVETCVKTKNLPVMAVAVSDKYWYSWVSPYLVCDMLHKIKPGLRGQLNLDDMIPLGVSDSKPRLVIGHNVAFDRSYIKEEYLADPGYMNFLDTMSMHILLCGYSDSQRVLARKGVSEEEVWGVHSANEFFDWRNYGSYNSLKDIVKFYLHKDIEKDIRDIFIKGSLQDIRDQFESLIQYCAKDVYVTLEVFKVIMPIFIESAPNPVTISGMLMMSKCFLPITSTWRDYTENADFIYSSYNMEMTQILTKLAQKAVSEGIQGDASKKDPWLKVLDWSTTMISKTEGIEKEISPTSQVKAKKHLDKRLGRIVTKKALGIKNNENLAQFINSTNMFPDVPPAATLKFDRTDHYVGYPMWYSELIKHPEFEHDIGPRPYDINFSHRITPILLKLSWNGFPLHYNELLQWGYLLPKNLLENNIIDINGSYLKNNSSTSKKYRIITLKEQAKNIGEMNQLAMEANTFERRSDIDDMMAYDHLLEKIYNVRTEAVPSKIYSKDYTKLTASETTNVERICAYEDSEFEDCVFVPIPHPTGIDKKCGNPLGSDYLDHFYNGTLIPMCGEDGVRFIHLFSCISFWRNNRDRICNHLLVYYKPEETPSTYKGPNYLSGAIIPRVVSAGTITRRAVEKSWLTASNPQIDNVGTEQKAAIDTPPGFCFVGADVDSEETWIASLIADSSSCGFHGSTPFSFMNIQGTKSNGTDVHSVTADSIGISRDNAKILNYGRLYGAGVNFAKQMIKQYQPEISEKEATIKAVFLYNFTKGIQCYELNEKGKKLARHFSHDGCKDILDDSTFKDMLRSLNISTYEYKKIAHRYWQGGTESEIFNILEKFAYNDCPKTPVLDVKLSTALHHTVVSDDFITSRMNWVVQSSAVDFLHMFLLTCYWAFSFLKVPARLCLCVHDEIRFMIPEDKRYEASIAMHLGNLFTRAAFSQKLGIYDLPQSVAFFSNVDIDKVLRKEPWVKCITPSNPNGVPMEFGNFKCETANILKTLKIVGEDIFTKERLCKIEDSNIFDK